jgi:hypothetical protein
VNAEAVAKHYDQLTPEERFRLILAAGARGDEAEQDRLRTAGQRIKLSMPEHAPYAHAFGELAELTFIELVEDAARYLDAMALVSDAGRMIGPEDSEAQENAEAEQGRDREGTEDVAGGDPDPEAVADEALADEDRRLWLVCERTVDQALAAGYALRTKMGGWTLFCKRLSLPPLLFWEGFPGLDRLQRALALAERVAFTPAGFLSWRNEIRPAGTPKLTEPPLTAEGIAEATAAAFRDRAKWWGA